MMIRRSQQGNTNSSIGLLAKKNYLKYFPVKGLTNFGSVCFMNAGMQSLLHLNALNQLLRNNGLIVEDANNLTLIEFKKICSLYFSETENIAELQIIHKTLYNLFSEYNINVQYDCVEWLQHLMDNIPQIKEIFKFSTRQEIKCNQKSDLRDIICSPRNIIDNDLIFIFIPVTSTNNDIQTFLNEFSKPETLTMNKCDVCESDSVISTYKLTAANNVLAFNLTRADGNKNKIMKLHSIIDLYVERNILKYNLRSVVCKEGRSSQRGHYVSYVNSKDDQWFKVNDNEICEVPISNILNNKQVCLVFYELAGKQYLNHI
jgi:ubiquitin C-terminal hydrolase